MDEQNVQNPQITPEQPVTPQEPATPPVQPQPVEPTPPNVPSVEPKKSNVFAVSVLIVVIAASVYVAVASQVNVWPFGPDVTSDVAVESPTPTPDVTASWKTYKNDEFGFEFRYPAEWKIINAQNNLTNLSDLQIFLRSPGTEKGIEEKTIDPGYSYDLVVSYFEDGTKWAGEGSRENVFTGKIDINGVEAKEYTIGGAGSNYAVVIDRFPPLLLLSFETAWNKSALTLEQNRIISTLKFIEPTANWKTYRNDEYGFEFRYPPALVLNERTTIPACPDSCFEVSVELTNKFQFLFSDAPLFDVAGTESAVVVDGRSYPSFSQGDETTILLGSRRTIRIPAIGLDVDQAREILSTVQLF